MALARVLCIQSIFLYRITPKSCSVNCSHSNGVACQLPYQVSRVFIERVKLGHEGADNKPIQPTIKTNTIKLSFKKPDENNLLLILRYRSSVYRKETLVKVRENSHKRRKHLLGACVPTRCFVLLQTRVSIEQLDYELREWKVSSAANQRTASVTEP